MRKTDIFLLKPFGKDMLSPSLPLSLELVS